MNPGDLVRIASNYALMYADDLDTPHIGRIPPGTLCVLLDTRASGHSILCRILAPEHGTVWINSAWVESSE